MLLNFYAYVLDANSWQTDLDYVPRSAKRLNFLQIYSWVDYGPLFGAVQQWDTYRYDKDNCVDTNMAGIQYFNLEIKSTDVQKLILVCAFYIQPVPATLLRTTIYQEGTFHTTFLPGYEQIINRQRTWEFHT